MSEVIFVNGFIRIFFPTRASYELHIASNCSRSFFRSICPYFKMCNERSGFSIAMRYFIVAFIVVSTKNILGELLHRMHGDFNIFIFVSVLLQVASEAKHLDLWKLAMHKRKLQLKGVSPIVTVQNGKMVRVYINQTSPFHNKHPNPNSSVKPENRRQIVPTKKAVVSRVRQGKSLGHKNSSRTHSTASIPTQLIPSNFQILPVSSSLVTKPSSSTSKPTTAVTNRTIETRKRLETLLKKESYMKYVAATDEIKMKPTNKLITKTHTKRTTQNSEAISSSRVTASCIFELVFIIPVCQLLCILLF